MAGGGRLRDTGRRGHTSSMEADIACHLLAPRGQPPPGAVHQEVTMSGTLLTIRLTAEDIDQLQLSISSCLQELFLLIQNMRPCAQAVWRQEKRGVQGEGREHAHWVQRCPPQQGDVRGHEGAGAQSVSRKRQPAGDGEQADSRDK
ncbi:hypothetical protein QTO34_000165 [Cnephaeus nilssonii]|uniref:Uncharacterized protein n=1 Tax=Cnephaeus nilssonii TaxID=3371016 RepID=A0AA40IBS3_CNENI|nr:hypothetical protein QTO34_000165 [Eptesicus nilssonii]